MPEREENAETIIGPLAGQFLKKLAADKGLSLEESLRQALAQLARPSKDELIAEQRRIRAMSPPIKERPFAEDLIREDRDSR